MYFDSATYYAELGNSCLRPKRPGCLPPRKTSGFLVGEVFAIWFMGSAMLKGQEVSTLVATALLLSVLLLYPDTKLRCPIGLFFHEALANLLFGIFFEAGPLITALHFPTQYPFFHPQFDLGNVLGFLLFLAMIATTWWAQHLLRCEIANYRHKKMLKVVMEETL